MSQGSWQTDQMGGACKQQPTPGRNVACVNNCGFFGNDTTMNMCPNCYRSYLTSRSETDKAASSLVAGEGTASLEAGGLSSLNAGSPDRMTEPSMEDSLSPADEESDLNLLARASMVESSSTLEARARFPRVQSASDREIRAGFVSVAGESRIDGADEESCMVMACCDSKLDLPADSLVRTNASRTLDTDLRSKAGFAAPSFAPATPSPAPKLLSIPASPARPLPATAAKPSRCQVCRKKVGLTGFKCRCEGLFCGSHRYSDKHECSFDYKAAGRQAIAKANPVVVADKIIRF